MEEELSTIHLRVARVYIENKSYENVIACFDRPETFFYLDPPYYDCQNSYGDGIFSKGDFAKLKGFKIVKVKTHYAAGAWTGKCKPVTELLISNF